MPVYLPTFITPVTYIKKFGEFTLHLKCRRQKHNHDSKLLVRIELFHFRRDYDVRHV